MKQRSARTPLRRAGAILTASLAAAMVYASPAPAAVGFEWSGTCRAASIVVPVQREDLDPYVPPGFTIAGEDTGLVPFALQVFDCRDVVIGGVASPPVISTEALVVLDRGRSPALAGQPPSDIDFYVIPTPSNSALLKAHLRSVGVAHELRRMDFTFAEAARIATATGSARREFSVRATSPRAFPPQDGSVCCTWQLGRGGLVRTRFEVTEQTFEAGLGELTAVPGSAMYGILGDRAHADGVGVVRTLAFRGWIELMGTS